MAHVFWNRVHLMTLQGHPRSFILAQIKSLYATSYWSSIVTLVLSCHLSEILELLYAESHFSLPHRYYGQNFRVFPLEYVREVKVFEERISQAN